jgi:hypothetical protein
MSPRVSLLPSAALRRRLADDERRFDGDAVRNDEPDRDGIASRESAFRLHQHQVPAARREVDGLAGRDRHRSQRAHALDAALLDGLVQGCGIERGAVRAADHERRVAGIRQPRIAGQHRRAGRRQADPGMVDDEAPGTVRERRDECKS